MSTTNNDPKPFFKDAALEKVSLALLIHSHQPVGNFDHVIEDAYQKSYHPFVETLAAHPGVRMSFHFSGILLEWFEKHHPEYFEFLRKLADRGQIEFVGGGYYEPILPAIPDADKVAQIRMLADYLDHHLGARPSGAWVTERVWEPGLARPLAEAGVEYVMLDDTHFLAAGAEPDELHGTYITEDMGASLRLVPSLQTLRYTIPFRDPEETISVLRGGVNIPAKLFASGDDCEKFGVWPGTYEHCYKNKWLDRFLKIVEDAHDWLETCTVSSYVSSHAPVGRIYLPTASYAEMMEWALPPNASRDFKQVEEEAARMPDGGRFQRFLRGGMWRNFFSKYAESNQLQKLMLDVSRRWHEAGASKRASKETKRLLGEAQKHLLAGQCNDPYWHGIFGGLYAPHLRSAVLRELIQAESLLDRLDPPRANSAGTVETRDFDADGRDEILIRHPLYGMVLRPSDGGTISSLRFKPSVADLVNSLMRRPEAYHDQVREKVSSHDSRGEGPASIHDRVWSKEANLSALLRYDRYGKHAFRTYLFSSAKSCEDFDYLRLDENHDLAGGAWSVKRKPGSDEIIFDLARDTQIIASGRTVSIHASKEIETRVVDGAWTIDCRSTLASDMDSRTPVAVGVETVINLLAPDAPDRYFQSQDGRQPLEFKGELSGEEISVTDEWQRVCIKLSASPQPRWWVVPIETISQSESGFERVYQGSAILAVWDLAKGGGGNFKSSLRIEISHLD